MNPRLLLCLALVLGGWLNIVRGADVAVTSRARAFVAECLHSTNVFVLNPPAEDNPYRDWSPAERRKRMEWAYQHGSALYLYPNGLPQRLESKRHFKPDGRNQSWHPDGRVAADELYENQKLVTGSYFDDSGKPLSEISNGTGRQIIFDVSIASDQCGIRGVADWRDGLRDGAWITYDDFAKGTKREEAHYLKGKLDGPQIWWRDGQKVVEQDYRNGLRDGPEVAWHSNGSTNRITFYREGNFVERSRRFFSTGTNSEEVINGTNGLVLHRYWYPNGVLMSEEIHGASGATTRSYDLSGRLTGEVKDGNGTLVAPEFTSEDHPGSFYLRAFKDGKLVERRELPGLGLILCADHSNAAAFVPQLIVREPMGTVTADLVLPDGVTSDRPLSFTFSATNPADILQHPPIELKFPVPFRDWTGDIPVDLSLEIQGRTIHYQASALRKGRQREENSRPTPPVAAPAPKPRSLKTDLIFSQPGLKPRLATGEAPPFRQAADRWICGADQWLLYDEPRLLLCSTNRAQDWQVIRKEFSFRPGGLACWSARQMVVWGSQPAKTPERGIPFVIEETMDGGKHWRPIPARLPIDYLLGVNVKEEIMLVVGVRLPKTGLLDGTDWFELPRTTLMSEDGRFFTELAAPDFFGNEVVAKKSTAPNHLARAYVLGSSFRAAAYALYASRTSGEVPEYVASCWSPPAIVWSGNSRIVALQTNGVFAACGDLNRRPFAAVDLGVMPRDRDSKIRALLEENQ